MSVQLGFFAAVASLILTGPAAAEEVPTVEIYRHSAWATMPPKGVDGDGIRMNLAIGDDVTFQTVTVTVTDTTMGAVPEGSTAEAKPDTVTIDITAEEKSETRTLDEGSAFNFEGYHVSIVAIYATPGDLGFGSTVFEIATVASLPPEIAQSTTAGGPESRLKVKHEIDKLTLHHSATPLTLEDDLAKKLQGMQSWGESDRKWFDIPYHFIVDIDGKVFEARDYRYAGDTNTRYNPAGHFLINCYGNYEVAEPNEQQLETVANLMAWAAIEFEIDPIEIFGHKDLAQTSCPGKNLYKYIEDGSLAKRVNELVASGQPKLVWHDTME